MKRMKILTGMLSATIFLAMMAGELGIEFTAALLAAIVSGVTVGRLIVGRRVDTRPDRAEWTARTGRAYRLVWDGEHTKVVAA